MSQHKNKFYNLLSYILVCLTVALALAGCRDELIYSSQDIPDTEVDIEAEVLFRPLIKTEIETRAEAPVGADFNGIRSLVVFFFDKTGKRVDEYTGEITDFTHFAEDSTTPQRISFKKRIKAGEYYVFAVTNVPENQKSELLSKTSIHDLRNFQISWDNDLADNLEMFGVFGVDNEDTLPDNAGFEDDNLIAITPTQNKIHSWVRRAASKVTVDFDGSALMDNVTVYIRNAVLKDVASGTLLGTDSRVGENGFTCTQSAYTLDYGTGETYGAWPSVTKNTKITPPEGWGASDFHDDAAKALPCYENMQGKHEDKSKLQDKNGDGIIDSLDKDGVVDGTYLEVEGYYVSDRPEYQSQGKIIYRFMLGQDAINDFNLKRNHHYKITMKFKDYGSDIDWHIEYAERYVDLTYPQDVNYQGKFFEPDPNWSAEWAGGMPNAGHKFDDKNTITLTSFVTDGTNNSWEGPSSITYKYYKHNDATGEWEVDATLNEQNGWLTRTEGDVVDNTRKTYTFVASMSDPKESKVNDMFPSTPKGAQNTPYNLSSSDGTMTVEETANCYMVGAPGWYCFPLVYGNAITGKKDITASCTSDNFVNHKNEKIKSAYIDDNVDLSNVSVRIIWQDVKEMVAPKEVSYDASLFDGHGGIKFHIDQIKEGNAVIALIDNTAGEDEDVYIDRTDYIGDTSTNVYGTSGSTKAIWSWHIWTTRFGFDFEKEIKLANNEEKFFEVMPVNLGWCAGEKEIRYYPRRKCDITFMVQGKEIVRTIEQYPYFALPRGDHPYYQWGRKDPFVSAYPKAETDGTNKDRWTYDANGNQAAYYERWSQFNPPRLYNEPHRMVDGKPIEDYTEDKRHTTKECLSVLIKNPDKWHNAPRTPKDLSDIVGKGFQSINKSFSDLWYLSGSKTIYDPCPPGYQVGMKETFSGFTSSGGNEDVPVRWYDVMEDNQLAGYFDTSTVNSEVLEFYADPRKLQSIAFPVTGYRDYDARAGVIDYKKISFLWSCDPQDETNSYHLKLQRHDRVTDWKDRSYYNLSVVGPSSYYFNTDGFAVRPVKIK